MRKKVKKCLTKRRMVSKNNTNHKEAYNFKNPNNKIAPLLKISKSQTLLKQLYPTLF